MSFEKAAALYVFCMNYHKGQWSREYRIMSKLVNKYKIKLTDSAIAAIQNDDHEDQGDWWEARNIYFQLVANHGR